jgi:hypothetical protein
MQNVIILSYKIRKANDKYRASKISKGQKNIRCVNDITILKAYKQHHLTTTSNEVNNIYVMKSR